MSKYNDGGGGGSSVKVKLVNVIASLTILTMAVSSLVFVDPVYGATGNLSTETSVWSGGAEEATMTVGLTGWYEVRLTGEKGGNGYYVESDSTGGLGGDLTALFYFNAGDTLQTKLLNGGTGAKNGDGSTYRAGTGGRAIYLLLNTDIVVIGAGGGGGAYYAPGTIGYSTERIDNTRFSAGGGGSTTHSKNGASGQTIAGCIPAPGFGNPGAEYYGAPGQNYLNTFSILTSQPNGSSIVSFTVKFYNKTDNALRLDTNSNIIEKLKTYSVQHSGNYLVQFNSYNNLSITGYLKLNKDDILHIGIFGDGRFIVTVNHKVVAHIGKGSIISWGTLNGKVWDMPASSTQIDNSYFELMLYDPEFKAATTDISIGEDLIWNSSVPGPLPLESGVSVYTGTTALYTSVDSKTYTIKAQSLNGDTIICDIDLNSGDTFRVVNENGSVIGILNKYTPVFVVSRAVNSSISYDSYPVKTRPNSWANLSIVKNVEHIPTLTQPFMTIITCKGSGSGSGGVIPEELLEEINKITVTLEELKLILSEVGSSAPVIHVIKGKTFKERLPVYDSMSSTTKNNITITNTSKTDGYIDISGIISSEGLHSITIDNKLFIFKCIVEPDSQSVTTLF